MTREIKRISITDAVVKSIKDMIESGKYEVGEKFSTEAELCQTLNVSRTSVREALRVLQTMGYLEMRPGRGAFISDRKSVNDMWYNVDNAKFYDFMEVRQAIETLSVRLAVERATMSQIAELEEIQTAFVEASKNRESSKLVYLDELFHSKIIKFTRNQLLININHQLLEAFRRYRNDSFMDNRIYRNALEPHQRIINAFKANDPTQAVAEMKRHLDITARDMEDIHRHFNSEYL